MDILVFVLAAIGYVYDGIKHFIDGIPGWVWGTVYIAIAILSLQSHLDKRLDKIERRLNDIQDPDYK